MALVAACENAMRASGEAPDQFFHQIRAGTVTDPAVADALAGYAATDSEQQWWRDNPPVSMLIDEVETIWSAIAERDDWDPLDGKVAAIRRLGQALGEPPEPAGHIGAGQEASAAASPGPAAPSPPG